MSGRRERWRDAFEGQDVIRFLESVEEDTDGGPMTFKPGDLEVGWLEDDGTIEVNWGCEQIVKLWPGQFEIVSAAELNVLRRQTRDF